jgi:small subunit ribosomal protein S1
LRATVAKVHRENVFFALPGRYEGVASLRQFAEPPEVGAVLDVIVARYAPDEGLYELNMPGASVSVADWSDVDEGVIVEALIAGHNSGGLECEVNKLRGFIPISQIALYRVDDVEQFVGEKWACVVTEANPAKGNLVLSRRAMLEREREASREQLLASLEVGQVRQGVVRSLRDFGAFVDLGGVDGLIHISKLSWDRVAHPSEVLEEGQQVEVKIDKLEPDTGKISLSYRDLQASPWTQVDQQFSVGELVTGTVSRIMDFGAFVRLTAGVEGLIHISELSHQRISRVSQAVSEGQTVEVKIVSVDAEAQRIALSLKAAQAQIATTETEATDEPDELDEETRERMANIKAQQKPLKGGTNRPTGGDSLGLNW